MANIKSQLSFALLLCILQMSQAEWLNGLNMPVRISGEDFGKSYDQAWFSTAFKKYQNSGANIVRISVYFNTAPQASVLFDQNGQFMAPTTQFFSDICDCLNQANESGIRIIFTLFAFECVDQDNCRKMIIDPIKKDSFLKNALGPLLDHIKQKGLAKAVYAIESFNKPEQMILGDIVNVRGKLTSATIHKVTISQAQAFVKQCNQVITSKGFRATIGSMSLKYSCDCGYGCAGNLFGNTGLTFYSIHYDSWMADNGSKYDPYSTRPSDWCLDKPALIGEAPDNPDLCLQGTLEVKHQFFMAKQNGWIGNMPWADNGGNQSSLYNNIHQGLQCIKDMNSCRPPFLRGNEWIHEENIHSRFQGIKESRVGLLKTDQNDSEIIL